MLSLYSLLETLSRNAPTSVAVHAPDTIPSAGVMFLVRLMDALEVLAAVVVVGVALFALLICIFSLAADFWYAVKVRRIDVLDKKMGLLALALLPVLAGCATQRDFDKHRSVSASHHAANAMAGLELARLYTQLADKIEALERKVAACAQKPKKKARPVSEGYYDTYQAATPCAFSDHLGRWHSYDCYTGKPL